MIVRERNDSFIFIEQDNHALVSAEMMKHWNDSFFEGDEFRESVQYAIRNHDVGWKPFDQQPCWNDCIQAPYTFSDYPKSPKMVIYTSGINEVESVDPYAALLCSWHYTRFLLNDTTSEAVVFIEQEYHRRKRILDSFGGVDLELFHYHYGLLKLGDDLSLYLCLNEPGASKENEHFFFKQGISLPVLPRQQETEKLKMKWVDHSTVSANPFPFKEAFSVKMKQKVLFKHAIRADGLIKSYENAPYEVVELKIE